jgi:hypothetical protein
MILVINDRKDKAFGGLTFYPKYGGGLIKVSGQIEPENIIRFTEDEVIYGKVVSGCRYTATLKKNTLKGGYDYVAPGTSEVVKGNIILEGLD